MVRRVAVACVVQGVDGFGEQLSVHRPAFGRAVGDAIEEFEQPLARRPRVLSDLLDAFKQFANRFVGELADHHLLGREVVEDGFFGDVGVIGDLGDARAVEAVLGEELACRLEDAASNLEFAAIAAAQISEGGRRACFGG